MYKACVVQSKLLPKRPNNVVKKNSSQSIVYYLTTFRSRPDLPLANKIQSTIHVQRLDLIFWTDFAMNNFGIYFVRCEPHKYVM